jgi:hypothetical protein
VGGEEERGEWWVKEGMDKKNQEENEKKEKKLKEEKEREHEQMERKVAREKVMKRAMEEGENKTKKVGIAVKKSRSKSRLFTASRAMDSKAGPA